jgi:hypothetical protein
VAFVEVLKVCTEPATWFNMAWPLIPFNCTGEAASQIKANAKRIKLNFTKFLIFLPEILIVSASVWMNIKMWYCKGGLRTIHKLTGQYSDHNLPEDLTRDVDRIFCFDERLI